MKVISIINFKGGVGKTTITANMGAELAKRGYKTLLIDTDPQSNLTFSFVEGQDYIKSYQYVKTIRNLYTNYIDHYGITQLDDLIIMPEKINGLVDNNLSLLCSHIELFKVLNQLFKMNYYSSKRKYYLNLLNLQSILRKAISKLKTKYDFILIDCAPSYNIITENAIVASDYYLVPVKLDYLSKDGLLQLSTMINHLVDQYNRDASRDQFGIYEKIEPKILGIIPNMVNKIKEEPISIQKNYLDEIISLDLPVFKQKLRESPTPYFCAPENLLPVVIEKLTKNYHVVQDELKGLIDEFLERVKE